MLDQKLARPPSKKTLNWLMEQPCVDGTTVRSRLDAKLGDIDGPVLDGDLELLSRSIVEKLPPHCHIRTQDPAMCLTQGPTHRRCDHCRCVEIQNELIAVLEEWFCPIVVGFCFSLMRTELALAIPVALRRRSGEKTPTDVWNRIQNQYSHAPDRKGLEAHDRDAEQSNCEESRNAFCFVKNVSLRSAQHLYESSCGCWQEDNLHRLINRKPKPIDRSRQLREAIDNSNPQPSEEEVRRLFIKIPQDQSARCYQGHHSGSWISRPIIWKWIAWAALQLEVDHFLGIDELANLATKHAKQRTKACLKGMLPALMETLDCRRMEQAPVAVCRTCGEEARLDNQCSCQKGDPEDPFPKIAIPKPYFAWQGERNPSPLGLCKCDNCEVCKPIPITSGRGEKRKVRFHNRSYFSPPKGRCPKCQSVLSGKTTTVTVKSPKTWSDRMQERGPHRPHEYNAMGQGDELDLDEDARTSCIADESRLLTSSNSRHTDECPTFGQMARRLAGRLRKLADRFPHNPNTKETARARAEQFIRRRSLEVAGICDKLATMVDDETIANELAGLNQAARDKRSMTQTERNNLDRQRSDCQSRLREQAESIAVFFDEIEKKSKTLRTLERRDTEWGDLGTPTCDLLQAAIDEVLRSRTQDEDRDVPGIEG